tara:strand:- start:7095 stop:7559 length:465 start_codon:yes stop_codon:yes gene_type:complete
MISKKTLLAIALIVAPLALFSAKKGYDAYDIIGKLQAKLKAIKGFRLIGSTITMKLDVNITNPTDTAFDVATGGLFIVRRINVFDKQNNLIAFSEPNISDISIPPYGTVTLTDLPVSSQVGSIFNALFNSPSTNPDDYRVETIIETSTGQTVTI